MRALSRKKIGAPKVVVPCAVTPLEYPLELFVSLTSFVLKMTVVVQTTNINQDVSSINNIYS
jgi:hypothetical protein